MSTLPEIHFERGLPASLDAERSILGSILLDNPLFYQASQRLLADDFALEAHRRIFTRMCGLVTAGRAIDIITLRDALAQHKEVDSIGGVAYLASLTENLPRRLSIEEYVRIVLEKSTLRQVIAEGSRAIMQATDQADEAEEVLAEAERSLRDIRARLVGDTLQQAGIISRELYASEDALFEASAVELGLPSGIARFDEMTCGFQPGELIVVGARPSMGKSAWGGNVAAHIALAQKKTVAFFSLETPRRAILNRMYCAHAMVDFGRMRKGALTEPERYYLKAARREFDLSPLYIDDTSAISASQVRAKAETLRQRAGLDLVIVDYIGLMDPEPAAKRYGKRDQEVAATSKALKAMAKDLGIPVIALAQLNRANEARSDKRPTLSDLRDSGAIEQDADLVVFLHRPSYYDRSDDSLRGRGEIIIAKQRNGPTGTIDASFDESLVRWSDDKR